MVITSNTAVDTLLEQIQAIRFLDYPRVLTLAEEALALARETGYTRGIVRSLNAMGWACNRLWQTARTVPLAREALSLAEANGWLEEEAYALLNLESCYAVAGQLKNAFQACARVLEIGETLGNNEIIVMALGDLGVVYTEMRDFDSAATYYQRSIALGEAAGEDLLIVFPLANMAADYLLMGRRDEAIAMLNRGLDIATRLGFAAGRDFCAYLLNETYLQTGDIAAAERVNNEFAYPTPLIEQLRIRLQIHKGQHADAMKRLQRLIATLPENNDIPLMISLYGDLIALYKAGGDFEQAVHACEAKELLNATWFQTQAKERAELTAALFEVERLERELEERKLHETATLERERALLAHRQQQELSDIKRQVLTRVAHDFRTPLSVLRTSFELLTRYYERLSPEQREQKAERIDGQFRALERLFNNALNVLRALEDRITPESAVFTISSLRDSIAVSDEDRDRVVVEIATGEDPPVQNDEVLVREILSQLVDNALKYSSDVVTVRLAVDASALSIEVEDHGPGIPENQRQYIFEPISSAHDSTRMSGLGLGLSLVNQYVHLLGGEFRLDTAIGSGTVARLTLPHLRTLLIPFGESVKMA
ncbi:MAG: tetratricopeptide repeat protein [Chloroflexi bacterium]|nr:tetratricopeptide repeat protein [Chloroflexota bacterium]